MNKCQDCGALVPTKPLLVVIGKTTCGRMKLCVTCIRRRYIAAGKEPPNETRVMDSDRDTAVV